MLFRFCPRTIGKYQLTIISLFYIGAKVNLSQSGLHARCGPTKVKLLVKINLLGELKHFFSICRPVMVFSTVKVLENLLKLKDGRLFSR
jgi:hypothetical protein